MSPDKSRCSYKFSANQGEDWFHCLKRAVGTSCGKPLCQDHMPQAEVPGVLGAPSHIIHGPRCMDFDGDPVRVNEQEDDNGR